MPRCRPESWLHPPSGLNSTLPIHHPRIWSELMKRSYLMKSIFSPALYAVGSMCAAIALTSTAMAETPHHHVERFPYASLQAEAVTEVKRESVRVTLAAEVSGTEQAAVAS